MQIKSISIKNFRSIKDQTLECSGYNVFVGANGAGKSTVLQALNVIFGEKRSFTEDDFWNRDTTEPIEIGVTFAEFSKVAKTEFSHYIRNNEMHVVAEISATNDEKFNFLMRGERLVNSAFAKFFTLGSAAEKKAEFTKIREEYAELPDEKTAGACEKALRAYEESMPETEKELVRSGDEFFGATGGKDKIRRFITWVYIPAVKDAGGEAEESRGSHLGRLIEQTARRSMTYSDELEAIQKDALSRYETLLDGQRQHLVGLERRLRERLQASVTSGADIELEFRSSDKSVSVLGPTASVLLKDRGFKGAVQNFGHGLQRAFLLVILQEILGNENEKIPTLILGCEEPELYQHPPQARHLASVLQTLGGGNDQVFLTTHSPYFVDVDSLNGLKKMSNQTGKTEIHTGDFEELTILYNDCFEDKKRKLDAVRAKLGIKIQPKANEIFFSDFVVLVEGISDQACLETYLKLSEKEVEFRRLGGNIIEAGGKSSLIILQLLLKQFQVPCFVIFDCDGSDTDHQSDHKSDNLTAFKLAGLETEDAFPTAHCSQDGLMAWKNTIEDVIAEDLGDLKEEAAEAGRTAGGHLKNLGKNPFYVAGSMHFAWSRGCQFPTLETLFDKIFKTANKARIAQ